MGLTGTDSEGESGAPTGIETTMQIVLPREIKSFVEGEVASGRFDDEQQVIVEALKRMANDQSFPTMTVAEAVAESLAQIERGEVIEWTDDFLERSAERALENSRLGRKVRDEAKY